MTADTPAADRRLAQKQRTRQQIVAAAAALVEERLPSRFTVDELVERADVSRRTIFNHFDSLDEILINVGVDRLRGFSERLTSRFRSAPERLGRSAVLDIFLEVLDSDAMPDTIAFFVRTLGMQPIYTSHSHHLFHSAFTRMSEELIGELLAAGDGLDRFDAELIIASVVGGMETVAKHWLREEPSIGEAIDRDHRAPHTSGLAANVDVDAALLTSDARARFHELLARLAASWREAMPAGDVRDG